MALDENGQPIPDTTAPAPAAAPVSAPLPPPLAKPLIQPKKKYVPPAWASTREGINARRMQQSRLHPDPEFDDFVRNSRSNNPNFQAFRDKMRSLRQSKIGAGAGVIRDTLGMRNAGAESLRRPEPRSPEPVLNPPNIKPKYFGKRPGLMEKMGEKYRKLPPAAQIGHALINPLTGIPSAIYANRKQIGRGFQKVGRGIKRVGGKVLGGIASLFRRRK